MIHGKKALGVIPARGGSKGVPRKNITMVGGKPLIAYTIDAAKRSKYLDKFLVSSEDSEILEVSINLGSDVLTRPAELALDETPGIDPVLHAVDCNPGYDYVVLLQPTSPLRLATDIDGAIETCINNDACSCVSVRPVSENPYWMYTLTNRLQLRPVMPDHEFSRRQDLPQTYLLNGAVYVVNVEWLRTTKRFVSENTLAYIMPVDRSLDIDSLKDLHILKQLTNDRKAPVA